MSQELIKDSGITIKAEIDMQISTARLYPRSTKSFINSAVELATLDEETAESCFYCLSRKDKSGNITEIKGPSIRLAEIAATCWGNLHAATRIVENDGKYITAEGVAWDLERNVRISSQVKRSITTSNGKTYGSEMQAVTGNAACAIALRNAIFKVVPKALVDRVYDKAIKFAVGDQKTLSKKREAIFERFKKMGISSEKIFSFFNKEKIEDFDIDDLAKLIGIGTSIKDGLLSIDRAFIIDDENHHLSVENRIKNLLDTNNANNNQDES